jgi:hypothetical protein
MLPQKQTSDNISDVASETNVWQCQINSSCFRNAWQHPWCYINKSSDKHQNGIRIMLPQKQISDNITDLPSRLRIARRRCSKEYRIPRYRNCNRSSLICIHKRFEPLLAHHLTHTPHQNPMMLPQKKTSDNINDVASEQESDNAKQIWWTSHHSRSSSKMLPQKKKSDNINQKHERPDKDNPWRKNLQHHKV